MAEIVLTRQQQAVVDSRGGALLVSAAAGSGKTKVLIDRVLKRVEQEQCNLDDFLMITFTQAAAAELRGKLIAQLNKLLAAHPENRHLQQQMNRVYLSQISTVHAFCITLLRDYAYSLDIPADFRVCDEQETLNMTERAMRAVLEGAYENIAATPEIADAMDTLGAGRTDKALPELIEKLYRSLQCYKDRETRRRELRDALDFTGCTDAGQTLWGGYLITELHTLLDSCIKSLQSCCECAEASEAVSDYVPTLRENLALLQQLRQLDSWQALQQAVPDFGKLKALRKCEDAERKERIQVTRKRVIKKVRDALSRFSASSEEVLSDLSASAGALRGLLELTERFSSAYATEKRRRRVLDYNDLEHETLRLLLCRDGMPTAAAREISARYVEIMVDEYQDTNAIQDAIFQAISRNGKNLFFVGDVKQSIYRFRLADPGIFLQKYRSFAEEEAAAEGEPRKIVLSDNFRSCAQVLSAANDVFRMTMNERVGGLRYTDAEALCPKRQMPQMPTAAVELHCIETESEEDERPTRREEVEAEFTAQRIAQMLQNGELIPDGDTLRTIRAEDIVILMRSMSGKAELYRKALLRWGIGCVSGNENIFASEEVILLTALLQIIDNPAQDIPLLTVLLSPIFRFDAQSLAFARANCRDGDLYEALCAYPPAQPMLATLNALRELAQASSLRGLLDACDERLFLRPILGAMENGTKRLQNFERFAALADAYENSGQYGLPGFLRRLDALREKGLSTEESNSNGAVRIMTIHKSKGLEFPVVFLADLCKQFNRSDATEPVLIDPQLGIGANVFDRTRCLSYPTIARSAISDSLRRQALSEEMRVLYVAMTRAQYRLVMTCCRARLSKCLSDIAAELTIPAEPSLVESVGCIGDWILMTAMARSEAGALFEASAYPQERMVSEYPWHITFQSSTELAEAPKAQSRQAAAQSELLPDFTPLVYPYPGAPIAPSKLTATQLKGRDLDEEILENATPQLPKLPLRKPQFLPGVRALTPAQRGTAIHMAMQYLRYEACTDKKAVATELNRLVSERFLTQQQRDAVPEEKLLRFFTSEIGRRILQAKQLKREFKFSLLVDGTILSPELAGERILLQGVTDCCMIEDDGLTVLDFKSDCVQPGREAEHAACYRGQLDAYSRALCAVFSKKVKERILYFFATDTAISI